jgi:hypothetical protein
MHDCGLYSVEDMRPVNELRMMARWKLGGALAKMDRSNWVGPSMRGAQRGFWRWAQEELGLHSTVAVAAQRIGTMPDDELAKAFDEARKAERLLHYSELLVRARPWWFKESRVANLFGHPKPSNGWAPRRHDGGRAHERSVHVGDDFDFLEKNLPGMRSGEDNLLERRPGGRAPTPPDTFSVFGEGVVTRYPLDAGVSRASGISCGVICQFQNVARYGWRGSRTSRSP